MSAATKKKPSTFEGLGDILAGGFDATLTSDATDILVSLDDIEIRAQVRTEFEDEDNSLAELGKSLRKQQLQAILLRPNDAGDGKPYILVAGERRVRAARLEGLDQLRALVRPMTDEEAEDAQFAENIHRKNLTLQEEARRVQRDLAQLGTVDAVLEKYGKGRAWLSKILALLDLPDQTMRLVKEDISADIEVINTVKTVEKVDPVKAKALVDDLKKTRGKANARDKAAAVKEEVKPSKKQKEAKEVKTPKWLEAQRKRDAERAEQGGTVATPKARGHEEPGQVDVFAGAKITGKDGGVDVRAVLGAAYTNMAEFNSHPNMLAMLLKDSDPEGETAKWLRGHFDDGRKAVGGLSTAAGVLRGLREQSFGSTGAESFALAAYVRGWAARAGGEKFNVANVFLDVSQSLPR